MHLVLIVKGNRFVAARAAADRGIPLAFVRESRGDTIGKTGEQHRDAVVAWFAEPPRDAPFPPGALLQYMDA